MPVLVARAARGVGMYLLVYLLKPALQVHHQVRVIRGTSRIHRAFALMYLVYLRLSINNYVGTCTYVKASCIEGFIRCRYTRYIHIFPWSSRNSAFWRGFCLDSQK